MLAEPVMTNIGMVLPQPGYWQAASRGSCAGTAPLLVIDETHTISSGPGGYLRSIWHDARCTGSAGKTDPGGVFRAAYGPLRRNWRGASSKSSATRHRVIPASARR